MLLQLTKNLISTRKGAGNSLRETAIPEILMHLPAPAEFIRHNRAGTHSKSALPKTLRGFVLVLKSWDKSVF